MTKGPSPERMEVTRQEFQALTRQLPNQRSRALLSRLQAERDDWKRRFQELAAICRGYDQCQERCGPRNAPQSNMTHSVRRKGS